MQKARGTLIKMVEQSKTTNPKLHEFLLANCSHLLEKPEDFTNIPYSLFTESGFFCDNGTIKLNEKFTPDQYTDSAGVYVFGLKDLTENIVHFYVGSCTNLVRRILSHYRIFDNGDSQSKLYTMVQSQGGFSKLSFNVPYKTTNYYSKFLQNNPNTSVSFSVFQILQTFTQYEVRMYEQAIISSIKPSLNTVHDVLFSVNVNLLSTSLDNKGSRPIQVITKTEGLTFSFHSIREAASILQVDARSIRKNMNYPVYWSYSDVLGDTVSFVDPKNSMFEGSPERSILKPVDDYPGINFESIPLGEVRVLNKDLSVKMKLTSAIKAAKIFGISKQTVLRQMNKKFVECTFEGVKMDLLFVRNTTNVITYNSKSIIVTDTLTNLSSTYSSSKEALRAIEPGKTFQSSSVVQRYLDKDRLYKNRYLLISP